MILFSLMLAYVSYLLCQLFWDISPTPKLNFRVLIPPKPCFLFEKGSE